MAAMLALLTTGAALADAGGRGTVTSTQQYRDTFSFAASVTNPCTGAPGTLSATAKTGVFHITSFTTGELWLTTTDEGTATFTPDDPTGIVASGHYAEWFGESLNNRNAVATDTTTIRLIGTDGSRVTVHIDDHFTMNANGVITVTFNNFRFTCG